MFRAAQLPVVSTHINVFTIVSYDLNYNRPCLSFWLAASLTDSWDLAKRLLLQVSAYRHFLHSVN